MTDKKYDIVISDAALTMLDSHMDFLARTSKNAALKATEQILSDMESLSKNPERYPVLDNQFISDNNYRKMLSERRYLIIYEISENTVYVDYIVDCRQDYGWLIQ